MYYTRKCIVVVVGDGYQFNVLYSQVHCCCGWWWISIQCIILASALLLWLVMDINSMYCTRKCIVVVVGDGYQFNVLYSQVHCCYGWWWISIQCLILASALLLWLVMDINSMSYTHKCIVVVVGDGYQFNVLYSQVHCCYGWWYWWIW